MEIPVMEGLKLNIVGPPQWKIVQYLTWSYKTRCWTVISSEFVTKAEEFRERDK
jgi:hypothetical protein